MKKQFLFLIILIIFLGIIIPKSYAGSVFTKKEEYVTDKTLPFFINIYSDSHDLKGDFEENEVVYSPQVHFFNKKMEDETPKIESEPFFVTAKRSKSVSMHKRETDAIELSTNYIHGKWDLKSGVTQEIISGNNQYCNYISFEPAYKLNENVSIFGGISHSITDNYDQTKLGFRLTPFNFKRIEFELSVSNYTKQFGSFRQKLNFSTNFKI